MRVLLPFCLLFLLAACNNAELSSNTPNRWSDERLWPVLEAQEHRDTKKLCDLLKDADPVVREAAALAFASVQDSASTPCLLTALSDDAVSVRGAAAFALGFVADSLATTQMAENAMVERDSTVQRALLSASFIAMQRNSILRDPAAILYYLEQAHGHERVRAADALRRLPDSTLKAIAPDYMALFTTDLPAEVEAMLVRGLAKVGTTEALALVRFSTDPDKPAVVIPNALRTLGSLQDPADDSLFYSRAGPGCIGQAALEVLTGRETLNAEQCLSDAKGTSDLRTRVVLLGLAMKHGVDDKADSASAMLKVIDDDLRDPYLKAEVINASPFVRLGNNVAFLSMVASNSHPAVKQASFQAAVRVVRNNMMRSRFATREAQYAELAGVVAAAINTSDAGLVCAVAELLQEEEADAIRILLPAELEEQALASLEPIRDLEARVLLHQAVAKRDGLAPPAHERPAFNHPINKEKLRALKHGQQYRIVTNKGEVIIATDVNECPGSSLAFDSLVTAGYYNGKAFHRMVPNFVVQGGCPRGDGYGGMPWTLRTEIGRKPFAAGAVGLASAGPDTESCQFFITHSAAPHLDGRYTRFGEVVSGMDVVWQLQMSDVMTRVERLP